MSVNITAIVESVDGWLDAEDFDARDEFINCTEDQLIGYHHTLGQQIRNRFNLWERKWTPELKDGIDFSPTHPDAVSFEVIKQVWRKRQTA